VPLYERGYEKDPAKVAAEAVKVAQRDGRDVVLVDTAGRMQVCWANWGDIFVEQGLVVDSWCGVVLVLVNTAGCMQVCWARGAMGS
jgi:hypothetical protein